MKRLLQLLPAFACVLYCLPALAQQPVTGRITDDKNAPLQGVNIVQQNTTNGTSTAADGSFSLLLLSGSPSNLEISMVGFTKQTVPYQGSALSITLVPLSGSLEEVVVVGYGTQRKSTLTGAVSSVKGAELAKTQAIDIGTALQGQAAGVNVTSPTGAPGTNAVVRIRGIGSLNNNEPLYVIDGIQVNSGLTTISPNDIESLEILKDASAAAIYGARASNGVILVTTKSGKAGKNTITVDASLGLANAMGLPKMVSTSQFVELQNEAFANDGSTNRNNDNAANLPNTDWLDVLFRQAITQRYSLAFAGGTDKTRYFISGNYVNQDGTIEYSNFKRYGLRSNVTSDVKSWLRIGENLNFTYESNQYIGASGDGGRPGALPGVVRYALIRPNAIPVYDPATGLLTDLPPAGLYQNSNLYGDGKNPLAIAQYRNRTADRYRILGNVFAEIRPIKDIRLRTSLGVDFNILEQQAYNGQIPGDRTIMNPNDKGVDKYRHRQSALTWTNTANYNHVFNGVHDISVLAGTEYVKEITDYLSGFRSGFDTRTDDNPSLQFLDYGTGTQGIGGTKQESALMSYFGRIGYAYDNRYLLSATLRADQSSRFSKANRTGYFPSASVGWNIMRESFMKDIGMFSELKLRGSWGKLGNQQIGNYPFATIYSTNNGVLTVATQGNPDVKWEETEQTDIGLDGAMMNGRIRFSIDWYKRNSSDILIQLPVSYTNGDAAPPYVNGAAMTNKGWDISVNYNKQTQSGFSWDLTANVTTLSNKVTSLYKTKDQLISAGNGQILLKPGEAIGSFYGYTTAGIFQNAAEVTNYVNKDGDLYQPVAKPGDIRFADINGDGVIDDKDRGIIGHGLPELLYSLNATVRYKQFDLTLFFNGVTGNDIYNEVDNIINSFDSRGFNTKLDFYDTRWHGDGTSTTTPRATFLDGNNNRRTSDRYVEDGSYLRLRNAMIGYNLSSKMMGRAGFTQARIYASVQNLFTITGYKGFDPELYTNDNLANYGDLGVGIDMGTYPPSRTITFGVQLSF
ncbi:TonB-dependent receptor [Terrimonas sp. NA20]|uniref:TonB-dependent receptor n=1 Tax=Terrimonas ginsenosidimutans TaxID=2908004 RepID=A0ABS9KS55_9BACT|nr:TonB-dependent receptor [Terrimonas ginsenosidimutans]MCG2615105.1 TonB-dependent receptor [Terrimonas ginsenosidimutans]